MANTSDPVRVGIGIGGLGVAFSLLVTALVFLVPRYLMDPAAAGTYLERWMEPIIVVATPVERFGVPLLAAVAAFYLVTRWDRSPRHVALGFVLGGLLLGAGVAFVDWSVTYPAGRAATSTYAVEALRRGGYFAGAAVLAALCAELANRRRDGPVST